MNVEDILETVKKSIHNHCIKQMINPLKKEFILILDNDGDEKITFIGIDFVLSWIQKIFDYKVSTYSMMSLTQMTKSLSFPFFKARATNGK